MAHLGFISLETVGLKTLKECTPYFTTWQFCIRASPMNISDEVFTPSIGMVDCIEYTCANMHVSNNDESMNWFIRIVFDTLSTGKIIRHVCAYICRSASAGLLDKDQFLY